MVSNGIVGHSGHVRSELNLLKLIQNTNGNVLDKLAAVGLVRTEEVAVA